MPRRRIIVVGGALSGALAAHSARAADPRARILLLDRAAGVNFATCGLAFQLSGEVKSLERHNRAATAALRAAGIEVRTRAEVSAIDPGGRRLHLGRERLAYDALVFCAGAESVLPAVPGLDGARNVHRFRRPEDLSAIRAALARGALRVAILGGGFLGLEAADGFLRRGVETCLIERGPRLLPRFSPWVAEAARRALLRAGGRVLTGRSLRAARREGARVVQLAFERGKSEEVDLLVIASGLRPRTDLLRIAGAALHPDGAVQIDARGATTLSQVYACGVCVAVPHIVSGKPQWFAQAAQADKTARVAGANAAGGDERIGPAVGTAILRVGDIAIARTGLERGGTRQIVVEAPSREAFFPGGSPLRVGLWLDTPGGRLVGAEVVGRDGVDKRIDVLAAAVAGRLGAAALAGLDLAYAPPYSAPEDPINAAARAALREPR